MEPRTIRAFIALPTPDEARRAMADVQSILKKQEADVKWDLREKFHITLKFLGNVDVERLKHTVSLLAQQTKEFDPFDVIYEELGVFPSMSRPRVVWIGVRPNEAISKLQAIVERTCREQNLGDEEKREFHPHITLGRVKGERGIARLTATLKSINFESIPTRCSEVLVMRSELHPTGSRYTVVNSIPLRT